MKRKTAQLLCKNGKHGVEGLYVEEAQVYDVYEDNYGEFFEDDKGYEHYLGDLDWEPIFDMGS